MAHLAVRLAASWQRKAARSWIRQKCRSPGIQVKPEARELPAQASFRESLSFSRSISRSMTPVRNPKLAVNHAKSPQSGVGTNPRRTRKKFSHDDQTCLSATHNSASSLSQRRIPMTDTLPIMACRHYDVEWLASNTCRCRDCGKQGFWTTRGVSIWVRASPRRDTSLSPPAPFVELPTLAKVG